MHAGTVRPVLTTLSTHTCPPCRSAINRSPYCNCISLIESMASCELQTFGKKMRLEYVLVVKNLKATRCVIF